MAQVSIAEAAKLVGRSPKTLYNAARQGRLSITQDETGARQVDISELSRVYGKLTVSKETSETVSITQRETVNETQRDTKLAENRSLRERLTEKDQHLEDLRNTVRLLEFKTPKEPPRSRWKFWR
jgi:hypothetical protein